MVKSLELNNFLKHKHLLIDFTEGLNIIRGANERGKSSALEGLGYNWFGSSALAKTIDDTVHRGKKAKDLKTKSVFEVAGVEYTCTRSSAGAELTTGGHVLVTGQSNVTAKIEELFGIPHGKAMSIIFAEQNAIRGILASGPTAAAEFIEKLGDFGQADLLVKKLAESIVTGSVEPVKEEVAHLEERVNYLKNLEVPDLKILASDVETHKKRCAEAEVGVEKAKELLQDLEARRDITFLRRSELTKSIDALNESVVTYKSELARLQGIVKGRTDLDTELASAEAWELYQVYTEIPDTGEDVWDGDLESLTLEMGNTSQKILDTSTDAGVLEAALKSAKEKVAAGANLICSECNRPFDNAEDLKKASAKAIEDVARIAGDLDIKRAKVVELRNYLSLLTEAKQKHLDIQTHCASIEHKITFAGKEVPETPVWVGDIPKKPAGFTSMTYINNKIKSLEIAEAQLSSLVKPDTTTLDALQQELDDLPEPPTEKVIQEASHEVSVALKTLDSAKSLLEDAQQIYIENDKRYALIKNDLATADSTLKEKKKLLKDMSANNALLKRVKAARLQVTQSLWAYILSTTTAFFSRFRGFESVVEKTPKGFIIDGGGGRPSGSTMDILGLAIRIAVAKTFSTCKVLILDEPSAGCDAERTALMTGGLTSAGFDQVILVTHKDSDESAGGNLIQL